MKGDGEMAIERDEQRIAACRDISGGLAQVELDGPPWKLRMGTSTVHRSSRFSAAFLRCGVNDEHDGIGISTEAEWKPNLVDYVHVSDQDTKRKRETNLLNQPHLNIFSSQQISSSQSSQARADHQDPHFRLENA